MRKKMKASPLFFELFEMMNRPAEFFSRDLSVLRGMIYFLLSDFIFTFMTQTLVLYEILPTNLETTFEMSIVINFLSIIAGFCVVTAVMTILNVVMGGRNHFQLFAVLLYSIVPSFLFVWIPFIFIQFITLFWTLALIMFGVKQKESLSLGKSIVYPIVFIAMVVIVTLLSQNYIFLGFMK